MDPVETATLQGFLALLALLPILLVFLRGTQWHLKVIYPRIGTLGGTSASFGYISGKNM
jgi:hypothetical protein